jgi:hypothetical protein
MFSLSSAFLLLAALVCQHQTSAFLLPSPTQALLSPLETVTSLSNDAIRSSVIQQYGNLDNVFSNLGVAVSSTMMTAYASDPWSNPASEVVRNFISGFLGNLTLAALFLFVVPIIISSAILAIDANIIDNDSEFESKAKELVDAVRNNDESVSLESFLKLLDKTILGKFLKWFHEVNLKVGGVSDDELKVVLAGLLEVYMEIEEDEEEQSKA